MSVPVLTFFNNKGGVGKTSMVYHLAWMFSELGVRVVACDLDPQGNLTSSFLTEDELETLWDDSDGTPNTIYRCVQPLLKVGDILDPALRVISPSLALVPGDLSLAGYEDELSKTWPESLGKNLYRPFRVLTSFWQVAQRAAQAFDAELVVLDVGPNLGAINRSALISTDWVVIPLGADLFSLQGLRNIGPTLKEWRGTWQQRLAHWPNPDFDLPQGRMEPVGYIVQQHSVRLDRPVRAYDRWVNRIPFEYARNILGHSEPPDITPDQDSHCLATVKHYRSLVPLAQEARKPLFALNAADGALGAHATAAHGAYDDFRLLAKEVLERIHLGV